MSSGASETDWRAHYEALRSHALGQAPTAFVPLGLGILRRSGLAAWMEAAATNSMSDCTGGDTVVGPRRDCDGARRSEIVQVLAGMAVGLVEGERA